MNYTRFFVNGKMLDAKRLSFTPGVGERVLVNSIPYRVESRSFDIDLSTINIHLTEELA